MREDPIFITGVYRSGTTFISNILNAHPLLNVSYDTVNYFRFILKKGIAPHNYTDIVSNINSRLNKRYNIILNRDRIVQEIQESAIINHKVIYSAVMNSLFGYSNKRWGEKALLEWTNIPTFLSMFSKGKAIHLIRDPRDVLASYKNMTVETGEKYLDAIFATMHSMDTAIIYQQNFSCERYCILKYEDLVTDTRGAVQKMCIFLDLDFCEEILIPNNYKDRHGKKFNCKGHSAYKENNYEDGLPLGRWKTGLSKFEIDFTESLLSKQMKYFNYQLSDNYKENNIAELLSVLDKTPLLKERVKNYLNTGTGVESYPSDPTSPQNWDISKVMPKIL